MKIFLLLVALYILLTTLRNMVKFRTIKQLLDEEVIPKLTSKAQKESYISLLWVTHFIVIAILLLCVNFVHSFIFAVIICLYIIQSFVDFSNIKNYILENQISTTLNSVIYKIVSIVTDISISSFIIYQIYLKW